ncbi:MAG: hypothetical protein HKN20_16350, partial [Gemmatimonadetes bacterium]|nr:hypothetical protein [Gemmatimonadota bacterium]
MAHRGLLWAALAAAFAAVQADAANRVRVRGDLQLTAKGETTGVPLNVLNRGDTMFDPLLLRVYVEAAPHEQTQVVAQFLYNDALRSSFTTFSAFVLHEMIGDGALYAQAGKIPNPFGDYVAHAFDPHRTLSGVPLIWGHHTTYLSGTPPANVDELLAVRGHGQSGFMGYPGDPSGFLRRGMPVLYAVCYDLGAGLVGAKGDWEYRAAVTQGSPGAPLPYVDDSNDEKGFMGRFGWSPDPALRLGVSGGTGSPHPDDVGAFLTDGSEPEEYDQWVGGGDAA